MDGLSPQMKLFMVGHELNIKTMQPAAKRGTEAALDSLSDAMTLALQPLTLQREWMHANLKLRKQLKL